MGERGVRARCGPRRRPCRVADELGGLGGSGGDRAGGDHSRDDADSPAHGSACPRRFRPALACSAARRAGWCSCCSRRRRWTWARVARARHGPSCRSRRDRGPRAARDRPSVCTRSAADRGRHRRGASNGDLLFADARRGVIHRFAMAASERAGCGGGLGPRFEHRRSARSCPPIGASIRRQRWPSASTATSTSPTPAATGSADRSRLRRDRRRSPARAAAGFDGDLKPASAGSQHTERHCRGSERGHLHCRLRQQSHPHGLGRDRRDSHGRGTGEPVRPTPTTSRSATAVRRRMRVLNAPMDVALGPDGDIYIADMGHHRVRVIDGATGIITTIAGDGAPRSAGDGGPARGASLAGPVGLALSWSKRQVTVFVAEYWAETSAAITRGGVSPPWVQPRRFKVAIAPRVSARGGWLYVVDEKGAVTVVNVSRGHAIQVAAVMTRGQRHEIVSRGSRAVAANPLMSLAAWTWSCLRPYRGRVAILTTIAVTNVALGVLAPWPLKLVVDNVLEGRPLPRCPRPHWRRAGRRQPRGSSCWSYAEDCCCRS